MATARVTVTLPPDILEAADRRAEALDRSRSWVVTEALRVYLASPTDPTRPVAREARPAYKPGLGPQRLAQLEADLALSPEERVRCAEETAGIGSRERAAPRRDRVLVFHSHEDFLAWEKREHLIG